MKPDQFAQVYPVLHGWIVSLLRGFEAKARPVSSAGFTRLPQYFGKGLLDEAKYVVVPSIPLPPLSQIGLAQFSAFETGNFDGITYLDTFFVKQGRATESLFFHEMIHIVQWKLMGPEAFLAQYADGLEKFGYAASPLEAMAYNAQRKFEADMTIFDASALVAAKLKE